MSDYEQSDGIWVTVNGRHIFVKDGETKEEAFDRTFYGKKPEKSYKSGDIVEIKDDITGGKSTSDFPDMNSGHQPMSKEDWTDDGWETPPTVKNFKNFSEYEDAYGTDGDKSTASQIGKDKVTIYRAQPLKFGANIPNGSWVALTEKYARTHAENALGGKDYIIVKATVNSNDVVWAGDSFQEWGYFPSK